MRPIAYLALLCLAFMTSAPARAEWRDIAYADMAKMPLMLKKVDPQRVFVYFYKVVPTQGQPSLPQDLKLQVLTQGQVVPVAIGSDGRFDLPLRQDWIDAGAKVQINQPKNRTAVSLNLNARVPPGTRMTYAQLTESAPVLERGIKQMAGLMSFLAPSVKQLVLKFDKGAPQSVTLLLPDGNKKVWKSDAEGLVRLPWEPDWRGDPVVLSAPLTGIDPQMK